MTDIDLMIYWHIILPDKRKNTRGSSEQAMFTQLQPDGLDISFGVLK